MTRQDAPGVKPCQMEIGRLIDFRFIQSPAPLQPIWLLGAPCPHVMRTSSALQGMPQYWGQR